MLPQTVRRYLDDHRPEFLEGLFELLRFPSVANDRSTPDPCRQCADWLAARLENLGMDVIVLPTPGKPSVVASLRAGDKAPTVLIYGHYDVQPPDPLDQWHSRPFEPEIRDGCIYARGADDDKGQLFAHLAAIEAWQRAGGGLPVNLRLLVEGEEEIGSPHMEEFVLEHRDRLAADACVISDSEFFAPGVPSITCALRGLLYVEVTMTGPRRDLHSGVHGGAVANPANAVAALVAGLHDANGRITLEGFYDDVPDLTDAERRAWAVLPFDESAYAGEMGLDALGGGEKGYGVLERRWARPTADCNGIVGGYTGAGSKTIIPAEASAKISFRLVPNQDPRRVLESFRAYVSARTPAGMRSVVRANAGACPVRLRTDTPAMRAAGDALAEAFGSPPAFIRCGASVPIAEQIQRLLGLDAVMMGFGLPDDNLHSPDERFRLDQLWRGAHAAAAFLHNLAALARR